MNETISKILEAVGKAAGFFGAKSLPEIIGSIIASFLSFLGVIFLCLIIYGGFIWMTSMGNDTKVAMAKKILINATIGLVIILASYTISYTIIQALVKSTT